MKNKLTFVFITSVLSILVVYTSVSTVLLPILTKNPLPKAIVRITEEKEKTNKEDKNNTKTKTDIIKDTLVFNNSKDAGMKLFELRKKEVKKVAK